jgi:TolB-like protein/DNA-binding winged helix-turn-helix (wHTH) protein/Tfp pilus assembly protein PilF
LLQVGHGSFDPLSGELQLDGTLHKLRPRTSALLAHLVRHGDRVVGKDELMDAIWPGVVVTDDSLVQCIKEIRHALGKPGRDWIRTVPRQGYAFIGAALTPAIAPAPPAAPAPAVGITLAAATTPAAAPETASAPAPTASSAEIAPSRRSWLWPAAAAVVLAAGLLAQLLMRNLTPVASPPPLSLIVLPLVNVGGDAAREHVADYLTVRLANALSRVSGTTVIAPGTAFSFKGNAIDTRRVGAELGVRYVIEGTVRQQGDRTVVSVRLADATTAVQMWSSDFTADHDPFGALPDEMAAGVARSLSLRLYQAEAERSKRERPVRPEALDLLARGRAAMRWAQQGSDEVMRARALLEEAVRRDDTLSDAWAQLARSYISSVRFSATQEEDLRRAGEAAERAVQLAPDSADAHLAQGMVHYESRRMPKALVELDRAIELNPNDPIAFAQRGAALVVLARPEEALASVERALRLSPRDPQAAHWLMIHGVADLHFGRDEAAVEWLTRSVEANARGPFNVLFLAAALGRVGRLEEARMRMVEFQQMRPGFTLSRFRAREPSESPAFKAQRQRLYEGLRLAGMPE